MRNEASALVRFRNAEFQHFGHKLTSWAAVKARRAGWTSRLEMIRAGEVSEDGDRVDRDEFGPAAALLRGMSLQHYRSF